MTGAPRARARRAALAALAAAVHATAAGAQDAVLVGPADAAAHLFRGDRSGFADAARLVVRDAETWRRVWATLAAGRPDTLAPPAVDFRREILVVAALGARPSAGYGVAIDTVRRAGLLVEAVVRSAEPGAGCQSALALVQPADVVRVPRTERPVAFVERRAASCGR